jgi:hypothetical protein
MWRARRPLSAATSSDGNEAAGATGADLGAEAAVGVGGTAGAWTPRASSLVIEPDGGGIVGNGDAGTVEPGAGAFVGMLCPFGVKRLSSTGCDGMS